MVTKQMYQQFQQLSRVQYRSDRRHYYYGVLYSKGIEVEAYPIHGTYISYWFRFEIHFDQLLMPGNRTILPACDDLPNLSERFAELLYGTELGNLLTYPKVSNSQENRQCSINTFKSLYNCLYVSRIDYAVQLTKLSDNMIKTYTRLLNQGHWGKFLPPNKVNPKYPKTFETSCYLVQIAADGKKRMVINFYDKYHCFADYQSMNKTHPPTTELLESAKGIFRLEVQLHKPALEYLESNEGKERNIQGRYLPELVTATMSKYYIKQAIALISGTGDYYKLSTAKKKIQNNKSLRIHKMTKQDLCTFLETINKAYHDNDNMLNLDEVLKSLKLSASQKNNYFKRLEQLNINPVTIPNDSEFNSLPNLWKLIEGQYPAELSAQLPTVKSHENRIGFYAHMESPDEGEQGKEEKEEVNAASTQTEANEFDEYGAPLDALTLDPFTDEQITVRELHRRYEAGSYDRYFASLPVDDNDLPF